MTLAELTTLFDYHYWARDRMLDACARLTAEQYLRPVTSSFASIRDTAAHVYSSDWVWFQRWTGTSPTTPLRFEDYPDVGTLASAWTELEALVRALLAARGEAGLTEVLEYRNLAGVPGRSVFWHMAQHVVNHASYHRGQITTLLRQVGAAPPAATDLIAFYRENSVGRTFHD
jgi:uncharacterized damage-inducible protein DinB